MMFRKATAADLNAACELYRLVCDAMEARGNGQWHWGEYPTEEFIRNDIDRGELYVAAGDDGLMAAACINTRQDPEYAELNWLYGVKPGSFHRLVLHPDHQGKGLGAELIAQVEEILRAQGW